MERIKTQPGDQSQLALDALAWIVCAKRLLPASELEEAPTIEEGESKLDPENHTSIHHIVSVCGRLIVVDEDTQFVRLVHYTTQKFFARTQSEWFPNAEAVISSACMIYLSFEGFRESNHQTDPRETRGRIQSSNLRELLVKMQQPSLYDYASRHWGDHARFSQSSFLSKIMGFLHQKCAQGSPITILERQMRSSSAYNIKSHSDQPLFLSKIHVAAFFGLEEAVVQLLKRNPESNDATMALKKGNGKIAYYHTPLMLAARRGHTKVVTRLIQNNAAINYRNLKVKPPSRWLRDLGTLQSSRLYSITTQVSMLGVALDRQ